MVIHREAEQDGTTYAHTGERLCSRRRAITGTRPFSILSPNLDITAGSTVTEPRTATATTSIVSMASEVNTAFPARNIPAIAIMTVSPDMSTARPDVAAARANAVAVSRPAWRSSSFRRK